MSTLVLTLLLATGALLGACGSDAPPLSADLKYYVAAQQALAADDFSTALQALQGLGKHIDPAVKPLVEKVTQAQDINAMRLAFRPLSAHITDQVVPAGLVLAYCPMVEGDKIGYWFQREGDILNPYFGASMLHCGGFRDSKAEVENDK